MRERIKKVLLWLWPKIRAVYDRCELQVELLDRRIFLAGGGRPSKQSTAAERAALPAISGAHAHGESRGARVPGGHVLLVALLCAVTVQAAPAPDALNAVHNAFRGYANPFRMGESLEPQGGGSESGPAFRFDGSYNLLVNCITGCSASSGFTDNSTFTVGSSTINPIGALYSTSTPSISSGNAGRVRMDANSYLYTDCVVGCSGGSFNNNSDAVATSSTNGQTAAWLYGFNGTTFDRLQVDGSKYLKVNCAAGCSGGSTTPADAFANPTTAGLQFDLLAAFNGTTWDRLRDDTNKYLYVDVANSSLAVTGTFWQATQPVSGTFWQATQPVSGTFWQTTQPVSCTAANCLINLTQWDSTALGVPTAYGTAPTTGNYLGVNAYITNTPAVTGSGNFTVVQGTGSNLHMVCDSGCSSSAGFADNSAFTVGTTAINPIGGLYDTGADPSISNGNAGRARIDSHSYLLVDGSQVTQPVSGTFWQSTQPVSLASLPALVAGSAIVGKVGIDQTTPGTTNAVFATNFPTTLDTNTGNASASTIREAVATNNPAIPAWGQGATGSAVPSGAVYLGGNAGGNLTGQEICPNTYVNNGLATSGSTQAVALSSGKSIYICDFFVNSASTTAVNVKLVYGTGTNCATSPSDLSILVPMQAPTSIAPVGQNVTPPGNILWSTPVSQAVCVNLSSANAVNVMFHWDQR